MRWRDGVIAQRHRNWTVRWCRSRQALKRFCRRVLQTRRLRALVVLRAWRSHLLLAKHRRHLAIEKLQSFARRRAAWMCFEAMKYGVQLTTAFSKTSRIATKMLLTRVWVRWRRASGARVILRRMCSLWRDWRVRSAQCHFLRRWQLHCKLYATADNAKRAILHEWRNLTKAAQFRKRQQLAFLQRTLSTWQQLVRSTCVCRKSENVQLTTSVRCLRRWSRTPANAASYNGLGSEQCLKADGRTTSY